MGMIKYDGSYVKRDGLVMGLEKAKIKPIRELDDLSDELSKKLGRKVNVVDVIENYVNEDKYHSLITGKQHDAFLSEYDKSGFRLIMVDRKKTKGEKEYKIYNTLLIYKEEKSKK
ncbi:hypothetical protein JXB41_01645 [Candidatus Woesearchaeota archaeon]|nr:hypothetical protein [Candidatus Woesearchaeota archaeon]